MNFLIIIVAKYAIVFSVFGLIAFIILTKNLNRKKFFIYIIATFIFSIVIAKIFSFFIYDPRPFVVGHFQPLIAHANDNGFPSDHTLLATAIAFCIFIFNKKWGIGLFILGLLIGLARVFAGVHHIQDILGSIIISGVVVYLVNLFYGKILKN